MTIPEFQQLRSLLVPLVESFEIDDPGRGLLAWVPVVGGTFVHPLTRQPITRLKIYGAGRDKIKIIQPLFLRSLPAFSILGFTHPSHLCEAVAKMLGQALGGLGALRDEIAAMGITLDLERDILRLRGNTELQNIKIEMVSKMPGSILLISLDGRSLHSMDPKDRTLVLTHDARKDLDELARLTQSLVTKQHGEKEEKLQARDRFAEGTSDVMILTEMVEESPQSQQAPQPAQPIEPDQPTKQTQEQHEDIAPLRIDYLFEMTGSDTEIWAHEGRLRLKIPFKVVQGQYMFYLEQVEQKFFKGVLISPHGTRHPVDVDFTSIMDIKEVFDRVMMER